MNIIDQPRPIKGPQITACTTDGQKIELHFIDKNKDYYIFDAKTGTLRKIIIILVQ